MIIDHIGRSGEFDSYYLESSSSNKIYEVNISDRGVGHHRCNCPAWMIKRNRNGGGSAPSHCKHITEVIAEREKEIDVSKSNLGNILADLESL